MFLIIFMMYNIYFPDEMNNFKNCYIPEITRTKNDIYALSQKEKCINLLLYPYYLDLSKISQNVEQLAIHYEENYENLNEITKLKQLKELVLSGKGIQNVDFIKDLPNLTKVYLLNTNVYDLQYFTKNKTISVFVIGKQYYDFKFRDEFKNYKNIMLFDPKYKTPFIDLFQARKLSKIIKSNSVITGVVVSNTINNNSDDDLQFFGGYYVRNQIMIPNYWALRYYVKTIFHLYYNGEWKEILYFLRYYKNLDLNFYFTKENKDKNNGVEFQNKTILDVYNLYKTSKKECFDYTMEEYEEEIEYLIRQNGGFTINEYLTYSQNVKTLYSFIFNAISYKRGINLLLNNIIFLYLDNYKKSKNLKEISNLITKKNVNKLNKVIKDNERNYYDFIVGEQLFIYRDYKIYKTESLIEFAIKNNLTELRSFLLNQGGVYECEREYVVFMNYE